MVERNAFLIKIFPKLFQLFIKNFQNSLLKGAKWCAYLRFFMYKPQNKLKL